MEKSKPKTKYTPRVGALRKPNKTDKKKTKRVGFVGGVNALLNKRAEIPVTDGPKPIPAILKTERRFTPVAKKPISPIVEEESETEDWSSDLETIDSENEDMERFCRRMCHKSYIAMADAEDQQKKIKLEAAFKKAQKHFVEQHKSEFRSRVKDNIANGKMELLRYDEKTLFEKHSVKSILLEPSDNSGLKQLADTFNPFKLFHYSDPIKPSEFIVEITWAAPSIKNLKDQPNKLPKKKKPKRAGESTSMWRPPKPV